MGLRILHDQQESMACLYDSVSGWAFGPVFEGDTPFEDAQSFIDWLPEDARKYEDRELWNLYGAWITATTGPGGERRDPV